VSALHGWTSVADDPGRGNPISSILVIRRRPGHATVAGVNPARRLAVLLAPVVLLVAAPAAHAAGGIDVDVTGGSLELERLAPGYGGTAEVRVTNGSTHDADVVLRVTDVVDDENGCLRQELDGGDTSCESAGGELSTWLQVAVDHAGSRLWEGAMSDLAADGVVIADALPAGTDLPLTLEITLPFEAGNDTMTDQVGFALRVDASADLASDGEVLGVEATAGGSGDSDDDGSGLLPFTGNDVARWMPWAGAFLLGSGGYLLVARRRGPTPA
jgi:LPXTG-motif cell wall-anchored protein